MTIVEEAERQIEEFEKWSNYNQPAVDTPDPHLYCAATYLSDRGGIYLCSKPLGHLCVEHVAKGLGGQIFARWVEPDISTRFTT